MYKLNTCAYTNFYASITVEDDSLEVLRVNGKINKNVTEDDIKNTVVLLITLIYHSLTGKKL